MGGCYGEGRVVWGVVGQGGGVRGAGVGWGCTAMGVRVGRVVGRWKVGCGRGGYSEGRAWEVGVLGGVVVGD